MRSINNETRQIMNSRRNFVNYATMTLVDGTVLNLKPSDFRLSGQSFTDDWVDGDEFQIGTAIGKTATLLLDNTDGREENTFELQTSEPVDWATNYGDYYTYSSGFYYPIREETAPIWVADTYYTLTNSIIYPHGKFSEYDFYMAYFSLYVCLPEAFHLSGELKDEMIPIGIFTVNTPTAHGSTIEITGVDNMYLFDKSFDQCDLDFSTNPTLLTIINKCCSDCGVAIGYSQTFTNYALTVSERPESTTYRQVVSWVAQIAGCNATITSTGALTLKSYDMSTLAGIDGGSFVAVGQEFQYLTKFTWNGAGGAYDGTGYNIYYPRVKRSGTYKVTKIYIDNIADPSMFDGYYEVRQYDSFNGGAGATMSRYNTKTLTSGNLVAGYNDVNFDITIETLNNTPYWIGVYNRYYTNPNASKFDATIYLEPISYADGDSADGGTFEPERKFIKSWNSSISGITISDVLYAYQTWACPNWIGLPGKYRITNVKVYNVADPSHYNGVYLIQSSTDGGTTWTNEDSGVLVIGDNNVDFPFTLPQNGDVRVRLMTGQDIVADPSASSFKVDYNFKPDDDLYLDGDVLDGGSFNAVLGFHNLTSISGTSVCTDNVKFTGVEVINDDFAVHYPTSTGWDDYAMVVEDNPFTKNHESVVAQSIYNAISGLNFRPFSTQSLQDPTIEAGDPCVIYDVKGGMYFSIITNVKFKTGGMTEVSCNAEPPARQISQYTSSASYARRKQIEYSSQVAHFNQIASAALGYYKTEIADGTTGAVITYLHNVATLENSDLVVKIANGIVAISDNYNTPQRSWNTGFDVSTGTMLLNLIYVHGLTSDWVHTGELTVGGVNNVDGLIHVVNEQLWGTDTWDPSGATIGEGWWSSWLIKCSNFNNIPGTYKITKVVIDNISDPTKLVDFRLQISISADNGSTWTRAKDQELVAGDNILDFVIDITATDEKIYKMWIGKYHVVADDPSFQHHLYTTWINTIIDNQGVEIRKGKIKLNGKNTYTTNAYGMYVGSEGMSFGLYYNNHSDFEVNASTGDMFARKGQIACYTIDSANGFLYNTSDYYCEYSYYKVHIGGRWNNAYWTFFGVANKGEFMHLDYGSSNVGGIWVTGNGANNMWDFSGGAMHITKSSVSCDAHGEVQWSGSDEKLKQNIEDLTIDEAEELVQSVRARKFEFKSEAGKKRYGFVAQEIKEVLPENSGIEFEVEGICNINYNDFIAPLCMIINKQQKEIDELKARLDKLEGK